MSTARVHDSDRQVYVATENSAIEPRVGSPLNNSPATAPTSGRVLLLVPTTSYRIGDFLNAAERLGLDVAVGSNQGHVLEEFSDGATVTIDFENVDRGTSQIIDYASDYPLKAIIGIDDETTILAAKASMVLGLCGNDADAVEATRNKFRFRTRLANSGISTPRFTLIPVSDDPVEAAQNSFYPAVLKPLVLSASRGVIRADNPNEFVAAHQRIGPILDDAHINIDLARHILVEEYIPGQEVAFEGLLIDGQLTQLALFDKPDLMEGPFFEETIYITPSRFSDRVQGAIFDTVKRAITAIGLREGPIHAELRINDKGVWLIEVAPRSIGGHCARSLQFGTGAGLEDLILKHALGLPVGNIDAAGGPSGVMMIPTPAPGVLCRVDGLEAARGIDGIRDVIISIPLGQTLVPLPEGHKYLGFIFAHGATAEIVEARLRKAHEQIEFTIEPAEERSTAVRHDAA